MSLFDTRGLGEGGGRSWYGGKQGDGERCDGVSGGVIELVVDCVVLDAGGRDLVETEGGVKEAQGAAGSDAVGGKDDLPDFGADQGAGFEAAVIRGAWFERAAETDSEGGGGVADSLGDYRVDWRRASPARGCRGDLESCRSISRRRASSGWSRCSVERWSRCRRTGW